ncbi:MAG: YIP1 family protein [Clostridiales bacterium]|nr:YIP1 family protein [Clostridiales bacterium]
MELNGVEQEIGYKSMGFFERIIGIVTAPGKVMAELARKPRVIFPMVLVALTPVSLYLLRFPLYKQFMLESAASTSSLTESISGTAMTAEMIEKNAQQGMLVGLIASPFTSLLMWLFITLIFFAVIKIGGGDGKFKHYLSVIGYSYVIYAIYLLLVLVVSFFTNSLHVSLPLTSMANVLGDDMKGTWLYGIMKGVDLFSIWQYSVMAIGLSTVSKFRKTWICYVIVGAFFIIGIVISGAGEFATASMLQ